MLFYRLQPILVFVVVALVGMLTAIASWYTIDQTNRLAFVNIAEDAVQRLGDRIENHMLLIKAVEAHFQAVGEVPSVMEFKVFVSNLQKAEQFSGVQGLGFARYVETGTASDQAISAELARNYGLDRTSWPETAEPYRTPIVMLEPADEANMRALGFDMCSEPTRRAAILAALAEERLRASGTVELVQENAQDPQAGFLMYTPFVAEDTGLPLGLIYAPFRIPNLFESALNRPPMLPVHITAWDGEPAAANLIYTTQGQPSGRLDAAPASVMSIEVAGRAWTIEIRPSQDYRPPVDQTRTIMLAIAGFLLASALAASSRAQQRTIEVGEALREQSERALNDREFLLQEMKHRIKNMIAQGAGDVAADRPLLRLSHRFHSLFQRSPAGNGCLAGPAWRAPPGRAPTCRHCWSRNSGSCLARISTKAGFRDPTSSSTRSRRRPSGLAFHELATNALKYGSARSEDGELDIWWRIERAIRAARNTLSFPGGSAASQATG
jgi:CHASE1-domain containing sensor protein